MHSHNGSRSTAASRPWAFTRLDAHLFTGCSRQPCRPAELNPSEFGGTIALASTSLGEASARIQATDLERRETPRVRTAPPGLRVEPKWLPESPDTPCSAKAPARGVPSDFRVGQCSSLRPPRGCTAGGGGADTHPRSMTVWFRSGIAATSPTELACAIT